MQRKLTLGLIHKEVCPEETTAAKSAPNEEHLGSQMSLVRIHHVWSDDGDDTVPEPVACHTHGDTAGSDIQREHFADNDPRAGTPVEAKKKM